MLFCAISAQAQQAQNRPYVDDKIFHFGFQLGMNFASFGITDSEMEITNPISGEKEIYHSRVSSIMPGFHVGFVTDLRLCRYLNLRFCPGLQFTSRTISYKTESGRPVQGLPGKHGANLDVLAMPLYLRSTSNGLQRAKRTTAPTSLPEVEQASMSAEIARNPSCSTSWTISVK